MRNTPFAGIDPFTLLCSIPKLPPLWGAPPLRQSLPSGDVACGPCRDQQKCSSFHRLFTAPGLLWLGSKAVCKWKS